MSSNVTDDEIESAARGFLLHVVQVWGLGAKQKDAALWRAARLAGFVEGQEKEAGAWAETVKRSIDRGEFNDEVRQIAACIRARRVSLGLDARTSSEAAQ